MKYIDQFNHFYTNYQYWIYAGLALLLALAYSVGLMVDKFKESLHGDAGFAGSSEIKQSGLFSKVGIVVGLYKNRLLRLGGSFHCALVSPTRSGKGVSVVTPTTTAFHDSMVVNDTKDELYAQSSKLRESYGQKVWKYAPYSLTTHGQNPLYYVSDDPMQRVASIQSIAFILYPHQYKATMWTNNARALFVSMVLLVLESDDMPSTIGEIYRISGGYGQPVPVYLQGIIYKRNYDAIYGTDDKGNETVEYVKKPPYNGEGVPPLSDTCVDGLNKFIHAPKDTAGGILSNLQAGIQIWASEIVDAATSRTDFDLRTLRQVRQTVYVHVPENRIKQSSVLIELIYSQLINLNMDEKAGRKYPYQVLQVMDEFGSLHLPIVEETIGSMAGYGLRCLLIFQSKGQIQKPSHEGGYGIAGAKNIMDNCACVVYFTPKKEDSEQISQLLGDKTVKAKSVQIGNRSRGSVSDQRRELMKPQELRQMSQKVCIIDVDGCRPIKAKKIVWYRDARFRNRLWAISSKLRGNKSPTELDIEAAGNELRSDVPTLDDKAWLADRQANKLQRVVAEKRVVKATLADIENINLDQLAMDLPDVPEGKMTEQERSDYVDAFWSSLDHEGGETIDKETGEITNMIDMSKLDAA